MTTSRLLWFLIGASASAAMVGIFALILFLGAFNATATASWPQPAAWLIHSTMIHSVRARSGQIAPPGQFATAQVQEGFRIYDNHCSMCHGGPGLTRQPWVAGMEPSPPYLIGATDMFNRSDLFWIVSRGIKMSGMPAWRDRLSDKEVWSVVAFLDALHTITPAEYARMRSAQQPPGPPAGAPSGTAPPAPN